MKKRYILIGIAVIALGVGFGVYLSNSPMDKSSYNTSRTGINTSENISIDNTSNETLDSHPENTINTKNNDQEKSPSYSKKKISSYSTTIYTKDSDRQNNISIACSTLNGTTIKDGETFSFTNTVGKTSSTKGYEKADVFVEGDVTEAMGGGICQVSTTLYNTVRSVPKLNVTERHNHSNDVPYAVKGKDAAVSYGSYDFKFVNNTGSTIEISASNTKNKVTIKLYKIVKD